MENELTIEEIRQAKALAAEMHEKSMCKHTKQFWEQVNKDCDEEIIYMSKVKGMARTRIMTALVIITILVLWTILSGCHFVSGCGTAISGLGTDITLASDGYIEKHK